MGYDTGGSEQTDQKQQGVGGHYPQLQLPVQGQMAVSLTPSVV